MQMFKLKNKVFHITRGDSGSFDFSIPMKDTSGYAQYKDTEDNVYWYDSSNKKIYDSEYKLSTVNISNLTLQLHTFDVDDVIRFKVFQKRNCEAVEIQKDVVIKEPVQKVTINLNKSDTKIGDYINKPVNYWYEIELNPDTKPQTVVCYDEEGEKLFILYPEGSEKHD